MSKYNVVILDEHNEVLSHSECDDFVQVVWYNSDTSEKKEVVQVHQSQPGNLGHIELTLRVLARMMQKTESKLFGLVGSIVERAIDKAFEELKKVSQ
jgi:hypothetical protein